MFEFVQEQLKNQFVGGAAILGLVTALAMYLRQLPGLLWSLFQRFFVLTIDVTDHDPAFFWLEKWLNSRNFKVNRLTAITRVTTAVREAMLGGSAVSNSVLFTFAPGSHLFRYKHTLIYVQKTRKDLEQGAIAFHETYRFSALNKDVVKELILEAQAFANPPEEKRLTVYQPGRYTDGWVVGRVRDKRPLSSVIVENGNAQACVEDLNWFLGAEKWHVERGIPYQRGYLFTGPPGNGKTSMIAALASHFDKAIYTLSLAGTNDNALLANMSAMPPNEFVLLEDLDSLFSANREKAGGNTSNVTFSGLLNAIDGVASPPGRVLFLTTNHPERLDPALLRPGRADRHFEFCNANYDMAKRMFERFFPGDGHEFAMKHGNGTFSMAKLQEILVRQQNGTAEIHVREAAE